MSEIKNGAVESANTANANVVTKKVNRRGIANARGAARLKFSHLHASKNGLFIAHLESVEVKTIKISETSTGMPSFNGLEIPKIVFTFASNEAEANLRQYVTLQFTAIESNVENIPGGKNSWKVDSVFDWIKHILNVYMLKGREFTDEEANALALSYEDFDEEGQYVPVEPEEVIAAWKVLFENIEQMLNRGNDGKSYYKTKDGKNIPVWIKLIRYNKTKKNGWAAIANDELAFPAFVGEGCIEVFKTNVMPNIHLNIAKERIVPMEINKAKTPNLNSTMPNTSIPDMGGVTIGVDNIANGIGNIAMEAQEDMPF